MCTMKNKSTLQFLVLYILLSIFVPTYSFSQHSISGSVKDKNGHAISGVSVVLYDNGKIVAYYLSDSKGKYAIKNIQCLRYVLRASCVGYNDVVDTVHIKENKIYDIRMTDATTELDTVIVTSQRPPIRTVDGHIYYLSKKASECGDPFEALHEIPGLISNSITQSISSSDSKSMAILVDGMRVNSGIAPISPDRIECVEVVDMAGAKYLLTGEQKILNIHTKKHFPPYIYNQESVKNNFPAYSHFADSQFEIGNSNTTFYTDISYDGGCNNKVTNNSNVSTSSYKRTESAITRTDNNGFTYETILKLRLHEKRYLSLFVEGEWSREKTKTTSNGSLQNEIENLFVSIGRKLYKSSIHTATAYYYSEGKKSDTFEATLWGNLNNSNTKDFMKQSFVEHDINTDVALETGIKTIGGKVDYSFYWGDVNMSLGNRLAYFSYKIEDYSKPTPMFRHNRLHDFTYLGAKGILWKIHYSLSCGIDFMWMKSAEIISRYFEPRIETSIEHDFLKVIKTGISYRRNLNAPSVNYLNPYNTSVDSLVYASGNPYLRPSVNEDVGLSFMFSKKKCYISLSASYGWAHDRVGSVAYTDDNAVYYTTYANNGKFKSWDFGGNLHYSNNGAILSLNYNHSILHFTGLKARHANKVSFIYMQDIGSKISCHASLSYLDYSYTEVSQSKTIRPSLSMSVSYKVNKAFTVSVGMLGIGNSKSSTTSTTIGYHSHCEKIERIFSPFVLVRWNMRKNLKRMMIYDPNIDRETGEKTKL